MLAIDTLKLAEDLKKGGFDERQTATLVDLGRELSERTLDKVATKDDLKAGIDGLRKDMTALEERMDGRFDGLRKDVTAEMKLLEKRMVIKLGGMMAAGIVFLVMLDRIFPAAGAG